MLKQNFPEVKIIRNRENVGFGRANNQAIRQAKGEFVLLLNPDTVVQEDTFQVILDYFSNHPKCGMVGCKILNPDGSLQLACRRSFPTPWVGFTRFSGLSRLFPKSKFFGKYNLTYLDENETYEVEAISGSFMFVRKNVLAQVNGFDESFFMYGEDLDLCYRIHDAGWKIVYLPDTKIIHFKGESSKKAPIDLTLQFYRAMQLFVEKHYHSRYFYLPQWFLVTGIFLRAGITYASRLLAYLFPILVDVAFLNLSLVIALLIRFGNLVHLHSYLVVTSIYSLVWLLCLASLGVYTRKRLYSLRAAAGVLIGFVLNASLTFFFNQYAFSRAVVIIATIFNVLFLSGWRFFFKLAPRLNHIFSPDRSGNSLIGRRTLIVGTGQRTQEIIQRLRRHMEGGYHVVGLISILDENSDLHDSTIPVLGTIDQLDIIIKQERIREVIFSSASISYDHILELMTKNRRSGVNFKLVPSTMEVIIGKATIDRIDALPLVDIDYALDRPISIFVKRLIDILLTGSFLLFTWPVYLWYRFFRRIPVSRNYYYGYDTHRISILEFKNELSGVQWWHILPQLFSVLKGDISLVGSKLTPYYNGKQNKPIVKPGLMGLAQLHQSENISNTEQEQYDLFYLKNYTPMLDIEIILKSIFNN